MAEGRDELIRYLAGIIQNHDCHVYSIGGVEDHLHVLTHVHPAIALAELVKDMKVASANWIAEKRVFRNFTHWQDGYAAFTVSHSDKSRIVDYIKGQAEHHKRYSFHEELRKYLVESGVEFDDRYLI
jgi:REP-associated tyrosine transposase